MTLIIDKPMFTLRRLLTNVKDKDEPEDRSGAVYNIKCSNCQVTYNGETGRNLRWVVPVFRFLTAHNFVKKEQKVRPGPL